MSVITRYKKLISKARFMALRNGFSRADYLRKHHLLCSIGENVYFYSRIVPSDPELLRLGDNVVIATNVRFLGHDRIDILLSGMFGQKYTKFYDCIEVGSNVFIGANSTILPGVKIGDNSIIGAGAVVTKDLPAGFLWGGVSLLNRLADLMTSSREEKILCIRRKMQIRYGKGLILTEVRKFR